MHSLTDCHKSQPSAAINNVNLKGDLVMAELCETK